MPMIRRTEGCAAFERAAAGLDGQAIFTLAQTAGGRAYYEASLSGLTDDSFLIERDGALVMARLTHQAGPVLTHFGFPIEILSRGRASRTEGKRMLAEAFAEIRRVAKAHAIETVELRTSHLNDPDGLLASILLGAGAEPGLEFRAEADLSLSPEELVADMRKGHRQQVRWGQKNLKLVSIDEASITRDTTDQVRIMHADVAGRVTRPAASWSAAEAMVAQGAGGYVLGYLDGELLGATIVLDGGDTAYYGTGVYRRDHFDKPLAHAALLQAMLDAKARGRRFFDVGIIRHPGGPPNDKEASIAYFKQGFSSRVTSSLVWRLNVKVPQDRD